MARTLSTRLKNWIADDDPNDPDNLYIDNKTWLDAITYCYWSIIPHDWRPHHIYYRLKCFCWHRYTTVRPRTLPFHTWCDRDNLMIHCMFEILTRFIEEECGPDCCVTWKHEHGHKIVPGKPITKDTCSNPNAVWVIDELNYLKDWWHNVYLKESGYTHDIVGEFAVKHSRNVDGFNRKWDDPELKKQYVKLLNEANSKAQQLEKDLMDNMVRLCYIHRYMWT